jgi:16S rRNA (cytosine967-C5)-methyltransferase
MTNVRVAAARVLLAVEHREFTLAAALDDVRSTVRPEDRGLLQELTVGTLRWRGAIDAVIAAAARRSIRELDPEVLAVLRPGVYQLRYLTRVPSHAVLHSAVAATRTLRRSSAASLVNAVLRGVIRRGPAIALPPRPAEPSRRDAWERYLSVTLSHPLWLVRRWIERHGPEVAEAWCTFNNTTPDVTVRVTGDLSPADVQARLAAAGIEVRRARYVHDALELPAGTFGRIPADLAAHLRPQDEAAQLIARMVEARRGQRILDLCAAPGGKTLVLADDMGPHGTGRLIAADYREPRVALLRQTLTRAGRSAAVVRVDARGSLPFPAVFDAVLVDAPCSGLGTVRREPDLKWARTEADLAAMASVQTEMLARAADVVRPGGRLVYATCSSEPDENEDVVAAFLSRDGRFGRHTGPISGVPSSLLSGEGVLTTRPDRDGLEVFYAAVLERLPTA